MREVEVVRRLVVSDAEAYVALRREMLEQSPFSFAASLEDDRAIDLDFMRSALAPGSETVTLGAFHPDLEGTAGIRRNPRKKMAHKAHIFGFYVRPAHRRAGLGRALLLAALDHARGLPGVLQVHLEVSETADAARRLYARHGFRLWGTEPRALAIGGRFAAEHWLVLDLDRANDLR